MEWDFPWPRKVCSGDSEEIKNTGPQGDNHTYGIEFEAIVLCFIRDGSYHNVSLDDWLIDVPDKYETRHMFYSEHIESVPNGSEKCSPGCYKAYIEVPKGYS